MQLYLLSFTRGYSQNNRVVFVEDDARHSGKHLLEVFLQFCYVLAVPDDFKQVFIANKVKSENKFKKSVNTKFSKMPPRHNCVQETSVKKDPFCTLEDTEKYSQA